MKRVFQILAVVLAIAAITQTVLASQKASHSSEQNERDKEPNI